MLADCGAQWVAIRTAAILGRGVDNWVRRVLAAPLFPDIDGSAGRTVQVVHSDDVHRVFLQAIIDHRHRQWTGEPCRTGEPTLRRDSRVCSGGLWCRGVSRLTEFTRNSITC